MQKINSWKLKSFFWILFYYKFNKKKSEAGGSNSYKIIIESSFANRSNVSIWKYLDKILYR